jgi:hypothetical protein
MELSGYEDYNSANWDGYGAQPVKPETLNVARIIAAMLREPPDIAPGGDGSIGFEWVSGSNKIFMDLRETHFTIYGRINGVMLTHARS